MSRSFTLGPTGIIPDDEYLRKIQETNLQEDPQAYELYLRKQLVDFRPDAPFFESDQTRDPSDRGSGVGSRSALNLRYEGSRSGETPDLPDGTFLDHEFMERDPRGTQNMPDFAAARKQREARGKFIKFSNDNDYSVPETGINPVQMVSLIRGAQQQFKDRYRNFEESFDGWCNGSANQRGEISSVAMVTSDGTIMNLADANSQLRADPVNVLSNRVPGLPRWTEPDHRVKVSKYGQVRPVQDIGANKWNENRSNAYLDHAIPVELNGQMVNRMLANLILDVEGQRSTKQAVAQGADYAESAVTQMRDARKKLNPDDIFKLISIGMTSKTQTSSAHERFYNGTSKNNRHRQNTLDVRNMLGEVKVNHEMVSSMIQSNRMLGPQEQKDLRDSVISAGSHHRHHIEQNNRAPSVKQTANTLVREGLDTRHVEESLGVKLYSGIKPTANRNPHEDIDYEKFAKNSRETNNTVRRDTAGKHKDVNDFENDVDMREFALPGRKKQVDASYGVFGGRSLQSDFGDMQRDESRSKFDIHDMLTEMVLSD